MNNYTVVFSKTADEGILQIVDYIALDNPTRGLSFVEEITHSLNRTLSLFPYSGKIADNLDMAEEIRVWTHGNYNSYYRVIEEQQLVEVLFIFHASRNAQAFIYQL